MEPFIGQEIDQYKVQAFIAQGGMAAVYQAEDVELKRPVALKVMLPELAQDNSALTRFQREARTVASLHHPNIIQIYTTGMTPTRQPYLAMQFIAGGSLQERLAAISRQGQQISLNDSLNISYAIAQALQVAHHAGIVHRDLKPSNILLHTNGQPVLTDLGIAAVQTSKTRLTRTGGVLGTPHYMSPEQALGQPVDGRTDIYAMGIILYELLSGHVPFDAASPLAVLHQHIHEPPASLRQQRPDLNEATYRVVETCLQKEPDKRFQSAAELAAALESAMIAEGIRTPSSFPAAPTVPLYSEQKSKWPYLLAGAAFLLVVGIVGFFLLRAMTPVEAEPVTPTGVEPTATVEIIVETRDLAAETAVPTSPAPTIPPGLFQKGNWLYFDGQPILDGAQEYPGCTLQEPQYDPGGAFFIAPLNCKDGSRQRVLFRADGAQKHAITGDWDSVYGDYETWTDDGFYVYLRQNDCCGQAPPANAPPSGTVWVNLATGDKEQPGAPSPLFPYHIHSVASDDVLNMRSGPGINNSIVGEIPPNGTDVIIIGLGVKQDGDWWVPVRYGSAAGWANSYFMEPIISDPTARELLTENGPGEVLVTDSVAARRFASPPVIDSFLDEWAGLPGYRSAHIVHTHDSWDGSDDLEAVWRVGWDFENLYLAVEVEDDRHVQINDDISIHKGDSVELQFDTNIQGDFGTEVNSDDYQINISPGDFAGIGPNAYLWRAGENNRYALIGGRNTAMAGRPTGTGGYILEAAIPWSDLGLTPTAGLTIGMTLNVSDNDQAGTAVQEVMKSNSAARTFLSPETWGTLTLSE